jgi:16S rRNA (guanine527-N7)-methyltransferase
MPEISDLELDGGRILQLLNRFYPEDAWSEATAQALSTWLQLVVIWNRKMDLTAARHVEELLDLFLPDSIILHRARRELSPTNTWLDVGSGAGAPGLGMAILDPALQITLVEPNAKRVAFLRQVIGRLHLTRVRVVCTRAESLSPASADDVVSRATLSPSEWLARGLPLTRKRLWLLLARESWQPPADCVVEHDFSYCWPSTGAPRRIIAIARTHEQSER